MAELKPNPSPRRVLIVAPHPDDAEFMAGGSLSYWHSRGASIHFLNVTDGTSGSRDPNQTPEQLAAIRHEEQRAAARVFGSDDVTFLGYPDGRVEPSLELRWDIARAIRRVRPDVIVTGDPYFRYSENYINHPDHLAVANATLAAIMPVANTRLAALDLEQEGLEPHDVGEIYLSHAVTPTVWIPLSDEDIQRKIDSLRAHVSQMGDWDFAQGIKEWAARAAEQAREHGIDCEFAEAFAYVRLRRGDEEEQPAAEI